MNKSAEVIFDAAKRLGLNPKLLTEYGLFEVLYKGQSIYFFHGTSYLNTSLSTYLARNKHTTRVILEENNLPNIPFTLPKDKAKARQFLNEHKKIMAKPTHGDNSIGVVQINSAEELENLDLSESIIEKFIPGEEFRTLVLNNEVIALHRYIHDFKVGGVKRISLEKKDWDKEMIEIAIKASRTLGLNFASVDFIKSPEGNLFILEINSSTGLWRFHEPDEGPAINVSAMLIKATLEKFNKES